MQKNIVIVGSSSALGKSASELLRESGEYTIGIGRTDQSMSYDHHYLITDYDFGNFPDIDKPIHGLIYCPGTIQLKPFHRITAAEWAGEMRVNLMGAIAAVQHYLPQMKSAGQASVIFVSTVAVKSGMPFHASVATAKAALEGLSRSLAAEYAPIIRFNIIAPGLTESRLSERLLNSPEKMEAAAMRHPMKSIGKPSDLASAACFLLSDKAGWITGETLAVDGGMANLKVG
jgi:NAD(P)-dependent dehydrogenase (short-subunit alcohol dehydrogenase family)